MSWSTRTSQPPILERALRALLLLISASAVGAAQRTERVEVPRLLVSGWLENDSLSRDVAEWVAADLKRLISYPDSSLCRVRKWSASSRASGIAVQQIR